MMFDFAPQFLLIEGSAAAFLPEAPPASRAYHRETYTLVDCPVVSYGMRYVLVGRTETGRTVSLGVGRAVSECETLNLAEIRHQGATLGASHVVLLSGG